MISFEFTCKCHFHYLSEQSLRRNSKNCCLETTCVFFKWSSTANILEIHSLCFSTSTHLNQSDKMIFLPVSHFFYDGSVLISFHFRSTLLWEGMILRQIKQIYTQMSTAVTAASVHQYEHTSGHASISSVLVSTHNTFWLGFGLNIHSLNTMIQICFLHYYNTAMNTVAQSFPLAFCDATFSYIRSQIQAYGVIVCAWEYKSRNVKLGLVNAIRCIKYLVKTKQKIK